MVSAWQIGQPSVPAESDKTGLYASGTALENIPESTKTCRVLHHEFVSLFVRQLPRSEDTNGRRLAGGQ